MTNQEAHEIAHTIVYLEFPLFYDLSVRLALFETYAVENIAKLLVAVSDLINPATLPKRYNDTEVIYSCFAAFPPTSPHLHKAIARMNYLHLPYLKSGKISQEDMLYVLFASMIEPVRFLNQYEWRHLTDMEVAALGTMWKYIGEMMDIDYMGVLQKDKWTDGLEFIEDLSRWADKYEDEYLRPLPEVTALGKVLMEMLLQSHPYAPKQVAEAMACVLMGNRLRRVFGFPEPSLGVTVLTYSLLLTRKLFVRYLCLPRFTPVKYVSEPDETTGRIKHYHYMKEPWYCPDTFWARWNPESLLTWMFGGMIPGDNAGKMQPEGLLFEDLGPENTMGQGLDETRVLEERVEKKASSGCPFAMAAKP
ncbi:Fc.00g109090.m01.CDS01 [Cosmosporella sp. VM-42]